MNIKICMLDIIYLLIIKKQSENFIKIAQLVKKLPGHR